KALQVMASLEVPIVSIVIGEGGSGGALALGVADRILMLEYSIYSVISPEGCASILWRDPTKVPEAAAQLKLTATDLVTLGVCDEVIPEAPGGAHRDDRIVPGRTSGATARSVPRSRQAMFYEHGLLSVILVTVYLGVLVLRR